uniref:Putative dalr anticodon-binding domain-containing protein 3 isoform x1 n=1 Tax=Xenopsylla cheopis TaxID=163159 RepID=A0A6M2DH40_XENCH
MTKETIQNLYKYLTNKTFTKPSNIVKVHTKQLEIGDLSFPLQIESWFAYITEEKYRRCILEATENPTQFIANLIDESKHWSIPISSISLTSDRCFLKLKRDIAFSVGLNKVFQQQEKYGYDVDCMQSVYIQRSPELFEPSVTDLRISIATDVCKNFLSTLGCIIQESPDNCDLNIHFQRHNTKKDNSVKHALCGVVSASGRKGFVDPSEFRDKRSLQMLLLAQHKYGIRFSLNLRSLLLCQELGEASVKFELLQVKLSKPIVINIDNYVSCSSKGISFILYNYARIVSMCERFDENVSHSTYPVLSNLHNIDCELLSEDLEWEIFFCYILRFPSVINDCVKDIKNGLFNPHYLCNFLSGLVGVFSVYYKNVRILAMNRGQTSDLIHARIYLIKAIEIVLENSFALLDITPITRM